MPDVFINEAKNVRSPTVLLRPTSLRIYEDQTIRSSTRVNFDVFCGMDFKHYPFDVQKCDVQIESFGYTQEIDFKWDYQDIHFQCKQISVLHFRWEPANFTNYTYLGYQGLDYTLVFFRKMEYLVVQVYIPCVLFAILAYASLFIPLSSPPARVTMGMTTLLTLIAMFSTLRQNTVQVSYVTQLDIWMLFHTSFVFVCIGFSVFLLAIHGSLKRRGFRMQILWRVERVFQLSMLILYI